MRKSKFEKGGHAYLFRKLYGHTEFHVKSTMQLF